MACVRIGFISATLTLECMRMTADQLIRVPGLWLDYRRFLRSQAPEHVFHTNWHHLLVLWPFLKSKRDWFWVHDVVPDKPQYRKLFAALSKRLRGFIPVSNAVKAALLSVGVPEEKISVIHNGLTNPAPDKRSFTRGWTGVRIGVAGQVAPWKGQQDLLEAFALVGKKHRDIELHLFGDGLPSFVAEVKRRADFLGVGSQLAWHGFVKDRAEIYSQMDICVVPSRATEALPTVAIEAAFFGLPVVATRIGGLPEIIENGVTGFLCEPGGVEDLAAKLSELVNRAELREDMGGAAAKHARSHFSLERFVSEFEQLARR